MPEVVRHVSERDAVLRDILRRDMGLSANVIKRAKQTEGGIMLRGCPARTDSRVFAGDEIAVRLTQGKSFVQPSEGRLDVVYEDEDIVVINKAGGMAVHPSQGHRTDTAANIFSYMYKDIVFRPVNRLDRGTSGLLTAAKNAHVCTQLCRQLHTTFKKRYYAVCEGVFESLCGEIDAPIRRREGSVIAREVGGEKSARTLYRVIKQGEGRALVMFEPITGRTHQIRVHAAYIGHPIVNDFLYGSETGEISRHALHCGHIEFEYNGGTASFDAPLPDDMKGLIRWAEPLDFPLERAR